MLNDVRDTMLDVENAMVIRAMAVDMLEADEHHPTAGATTNFCDDIIAMGINSASMGALEIK